MSLNYTKKQLIYYFVGLIILGFAINCAIIADLGIGCWDAAYVGLNAKTSLSVGMWINIFAFIFLVLAAIIERKRIKIECLIASLIIGVSVDSWNLLIFQYIEISNIPLRSLFFIINILLIGFGAGMYLSSKLPENPIDCLMMVITKHFHISITLCKTLIEGSGLVIGFLFNGPIALGTLILLFAYGPVIQFFHQYFNKQISEHA